VATKKNVNKNDPNQKSQVKQNKLISSEHCEKYKNYILRMKKRAGYGINCSK